MFVVAPPRFDFVADADAVCVPFRFFPFPFVFLIVDAAAALVIVAGVVVPTDARGAGVVYSSLTWPSFLLRDFFLGPGVACIASLGFIGDPKGRSRCEVEDYVRTRTAARFPAASGVRSLASALDTKDGCIIE